MISYTHITEPANDSKWKRWRRDCAKATKDILSGVAAGKPPAIGRLYKRKSIKESFYFNNEGPFHGKCGFCETYLTQFQNPDIEHYRPKLGVTDENDVPVKVNYGKGKVDHPGYYWLAYEWRNLLPACAKCNQASVIGGEKVGKHNRFPTAGIHARDENEIPLEHPLLLNPLEEDPSQHIRVNTADGMLEPKNGSIRGTMTIDVLGLNIRDHLQKRRLAKIREIKAMFVELIHNSDEQDRVLTELKKMKEGHGEYTAAARAIIRELGTTFGKLL